MQTMFYFDDIAQLADFEAFEVKPVVNSHSEVGLEPQEPSFWSVIGTLKDGKGVSLPRRKFPVADFPSELYAGLFATLCEQATGKA